MDGREMERIAMGNKNWARTGFTGSPLPRAVAPAPTEPAATPTRPAENPLPAPSPTPEEMKYGGGSTGITAIKVDGRLHAIRKPSDSDTPSDKLNIELLEFMFRSYSQNGLLPVSDLVGFLEKNGLMPYLESRRPEQEGHLTDRKDLLTILACLDAKEQSVEGRTDSRVPRDEKGRNVMDVSEMMGRIEIIRQEIRSFLNR
jgi:hypothetical protein